MGRYDYVYPHKIFYNILPFTQPWREASFDSNSNNVVSVDSFFGWNDATNPRLEKAKIPRLKSELERFQRTLRAIHKRKVLWPVNESLLSRLSPKEYLMALLEPITIMLNQIRSNEILNIVVDCISIEFKEPICGATFVLREKGEDVKYTTPLFNLPIIVALPGDLFDSQGMPSLHVNQVLSRALESFSWVPVVVVTNFKQIAVFCTPTYAYGNPPVFERVGTNQPTAALRAITFACLSKFLNSGWFTFLDYHTDMDLDLILPEGPPHDPNAPLTPDEVIFATCRKHSDFDLPTLVRDGKRALQFFRWHKHVQRNNSKLVADSGDTLFAATNAIGLAVQVPSAHPVYPFDASELPAHTREHFQSIKRKSPLCAAGLAMRFQKSKCFTLEVQNVVSEGSQRGICTVYRCQITSIDNETVSSSPSLCLKLFDDRFQFIECPRVKGEKFDDEFDERDLACYFDGFNVAETYALNEISAYDKLSPVQGSIVPWFYGGHQFTLSNGMVLYGLLMEYIQGWDLRSDLTKSLSQGRKIKMIESCRHAVRALDVADISQPDWHAGHILLYQNPGTKINHVVIVNFASTTQTLFLDRPNYVANYADVFRLLLILSWGNGFERELVWENFEHPDEWDPVNETLAETRDGTDFEFRAQAEDMFRFIFDF